MIHEETRDMIFKAGLLNGTISIHLTWREMGCLALLAAGGLRPILLIEADSPVLCQEIQTFAERIARYASWVDQLSEAAVKLDATGENRGEGR